MSALFYSERDNSATEDDQLQITDCPSLSCTCVRTATPGLGSVYSGGGTPIQPGARVARRTTPGVHRPQPWCRSPHACAGQGGAEITDNAILHLPQFC